MRLQPVIHADTRLKEAPYRGHAGILGHVRPFSSPLVQVSFRVHDRVCGVQGLGVEV